MQRNESSAAGRFTRTDSCLNKYAATDWTTPGSLGDTLGVNTLALETPRLTLRLPAERDADAFAEMHQDPEVTKYLVGGSPAIVGPDVAWRNIAMLLGHWQLRGFGSWSVEEKVSGTLVGRVGFWKPPSWSDVELTWLIRRSHWGQGYATEAADRAISWARLDTKIDRIASLILPLNKRSIRVATKLGERLVGEREVAGVIHHEYQLVLPRDVGVAPSKEE